MARTEKNGTCEDQPELTLGITEEIMRIRAVSNGIESKKQSGSSRCSV